MNASPVEFTHERVLELVRELARRLEVAGVEAEIRICGGSAIAMIDPSRRTTSDIDAVIKPLAPVLREAAAMAAEMGLPEDWINNSVSAYVPAIPEENWIPVETGKGCVVVMRAPAEALLAMKLASVRASDFDDLPPLVRACGITSVEAGIRIFHEHFPDGVMGAEVSEDDLRLDLEDALRELGAHGGSDPEDTATP